EALLSRGATTEADLALEIRAPRPSSYVLPAATKHADRLQTEIQLHPELRAAAGGERADPSAGERGPSPFRVRPAKAPLVEPLPEDLNRGREQPKRGYGQ